jgi:arsenate reductase
MLLLGVVGSGVLVDDLAGDPGVALLAHALAVAGALGAAILALGKVSGGHFNPAVSFAVLLARGLTGAEFAAYVAAQLAGGVLGTVAVHAMFGLPALQVGTTERAGGGILLGEFVATAGLVLVIWGVVRRGDGLGLGAIAAWIGAAVYFTSSHSFANPAVSIARALTDTWTGIRPLDAAAFLPVELAAAAAATALAMYLFPSPLPSEQVVVAPEAGAEEE